MMYWVKLCPKCKTPNQGDMIFCGKCGGALPDVKTESVEPPIKPYAPPKTEKPAPAPVVKPDAIECRIVDFDIPFVSLVGLMVKFALAAIPALIILTVLAVFAIAVLSSFGTFV